MDSVIDNIFRFNTKNPSATVSIVDDVLELKNDIRCDLLSSISSTEFSLALLDKKQNKFLALEVFRNEKSSDQEKQTEWLKEISEASFILKSHKFKTASVAVVNELATFIPSALFSDADAEKYFQFNFNIDDVSIQSETIRTFDVVNTFAVSFTLKEAINRIFNHPAIHHHTTALLEGIHLVCKQSNEKTMLLNIRDGFADIIVTEEKKLIFTNSFSCRNSDDLIYYVMFVCDRMQLNPETVSTRVMGQIERESSSYNILYKYIRNISFALRPDVFDFSYTFKEIPSHFYFNLFSLALCES